MPLAAGNPLEILRESAAGGPAKLRGMNTAVLRCAALVLALAVLSSCNREPLSDEDLAPQLSLTHHARRAENNPGLIIDFTLTNSGALAVDGAEIVCDQLSASGAVLKSARVNIPGPIAPGQSLTRKDFDTGFERASVTPVNCRAIAY